MLTMTKRPAAGITSGFVVEIHVVDGGADAIRSGQVGGPLPRAADDAGFTVATYSKVFDAAGQAEDYARGLLRRMPWAVGGRVSFWVAANDEHGERYVHWSYVTP